LDADSKPCPVCGESIKSVALKCRFCNTDLQAFAAARELEIERDVFSGNPAIIFSAGQLVPFIVAFLAAVGIAYAIGSSSAFLYAFLAFVAVSVVIVLVFWVKSRGTHYQITTQRIKLERGLLSKAQESLEIFRIDHFELRKPFGKRLLGQASLHLFSSDAEFENFYIYGIPNLEALADQLREFQLRERRRRGLTTFVKA